MASRIRIALAAFFLSVQGNRSLINGADRTLFAGFYNENRIIVLIILDTNTPSPCGSNNLSSACPVSAGSAYNPPLRVGLTCRCAARRAGPWAGSPRLRSSPLFPHYLIDHIDCGDKGCNVISLCTKSLSLVLPNVVGDFLGLGFYLVVRYILFTASVQVT